MAYDGTITIGTNLVTDKFDKQLKNLEEKIKTEEEKTKLKLNAKLQSEEELEEHKKEILKIEKAYEQTSQQVEHLQNIMSKQGKGISLIPQDFTDLQDYDLIVKENEKLGEQLDKAYAKQIKLNNKVEKTTLAYNQSVKSVNNLKSKVSEINLKKQQNDINNIKNNFDKVINSSSNFIKKLGKMALGVLSIASAYKLVSSASSNLKQYDKEYASNLEFISYLLSQTLAPALRSLVNLAGTLLSYLNYIVNRWFGITLFSKNSAKNFMNAQKSTSKMKKDLQAMPFDEMNILQDTSSSGTSGAVAPTIDPSMLAGNIPDWLKWLAEHRDEILATIAGITAGLIAWQLGLSGIKALGIGVLVAGIVYTIESLLEYLQDPSWNNFGKIIQGIGVAILGLGVVIGSVPLMVAGAIVLIIGTITKYWEQIKSFFQNGIDWLKGKSDWIHEVFGDTIGDVYDYFIETLQRILDAFDSLFTTIKKIFDDIISIIKDIINGDWSQAWEDAKKLVVDVFQGIWNVVKNIFFAIGSLAVSIATGIGGVISNVFKAVVNAVIKAIENILNTPIRTINGLIKVVNNVPGVNMSTLPTFKLPRLKSGGIINMPGRGIPVGIGSAIAGEAGREGVIPLTDSQAMEILGEAIGRYITINANITNSMNGRVISREIQRINNENEFAYNS